MMTRLYKNATQIKGQRKVILDFLVQDGKFAAIEQDIDQNRADEVVDLQFATIIPGLFDIHTHGALGYDFNMATLDQMKIVMKYYQENGVTSVLPTVMTDHPSIIEQQLRLLSNLKPLYPIMKGIHLEGPFLSHRYKGAQPESGLLKPDISLFKRYMEASGYLINYLTLAPETEGALELIDYCKSIGVSVSLGHSDASFEETTCALKRGAISFTHLFNAMRPLHHHEPGIVGAALMSHAYVEMITDGKHLNKNTLLFLKKIRGLKKLIIITDSIMAAGLSDGKYLLGKAPIDVKDGDARLVSNNVRAGSILNPFQAVLNFSRYSKTPLARAVDLMSINPAKMLGMSDEIGSIDVGKFADFLIVDKNDLLAVYSMGNLVYKKE